MRKLIDKKTTKLMDQCCQVCGEDDYDLLDVHRIKQGSEGGKYTKHNTVTLCCRCHRLTHTGKIKILGKFPSTLGRDVILYINEQGEEVMV